VTVEQLSGKPVQLDPALPRRRGSWQAGGCSCFTPGWYLSQQGRAPVISHGDGARQGPMGLMGSVGGVGNLASCGTSSRLGSGPDWCLGSRWSWIWQHGQGAGIPAWCGSGSWRPAWLGMGILPCVGLAWGSGLAQPEGQRA
jgi:hypothetical protein